MFLINLAIILLCFFIGIYYEKYSYALITFFSVNIVAYLVFLGVTDVNLISMIFLNDFWNFLLILILQFFLISFFYLFDSSSVQEDIRNIINKYFVSNFSKSIFLLFIVLFIPDTHLILHVTFIIFLSLLLKFPKHITFFIIFSGEISNLAFMYIGNNDYNFVTNNIDEFIIFEILLFIQIIYLYISTTEQKKITLVDDLKKYKTIIIIIVAQFSLFILLGNSFPLKFFMNIQIITTLICVFIFEDKQQRKNIVRNKSFPLLFSVIGSLLLIIIFFYLPLLLSVLLALIVFLIIILLTNIQKGINFTNDLQKLKKNCIDSFILLISLYILTELFKANLPVFTQTISDGVINIESSKEVLPIVVMNLVRIFGNISEFNFGHIDIISEFNYFIQKATIVVMPLSIFNFNYFWYTKSQLNSNEEEVSTSFYMILIFYLVLVVSLILLI